MNKENVAKTDVQPADSKEERLSGREINLLSDTGMAVSQTIIKRQIVKASSLLMAVTLLLSAGVFYYGYVVNRQRQALNSQRAVLQQQVVLLEQQLKVLASSQQRMSKVRKLLSEKNGQVSPGAIEQEVVTLAKEVGASIITLGWKESTLDTRLKLSNISTVHWLLEKLKQRESEGLWSGVKVADMGRQQDTSYTVEFTANLKKNSKNDVE